MIECVSVGNMRRSDAYTIANFVPSMELIRRAAYGVFRSVDWSGKIAILCGSGNNGADGFALACILKAHDIDCGVYTVGGRLHEDCAAYAEMAEQQGVFAAPYSVGCLRDYDIVVDCMLGTGFHGVPRESYRNAIREINALGAYVVSVDINSGMNGDGGEVTDAVRSDLTVTIGFVKKGLVTDQAAGYIGRLVCVDIGIVLSEEEDYICSDSEWIAMGADREADRSVKDGRTYHRRPAYLDMDVKQYDV